MKKVITSLAALAILSGAASAQNVPILTTVVNPANGHTYHLLDNSDWTTAQATAVTLGGNLATVEDIAENTFLTTNFSDYNGVTRHLWIGFTDAVLEGTWLWASGSSNTFTNWWIAGGSPNNSLANDPIHGEDYCCIYPTGEWEDLHDHASSTWFPVLCGVVEVEGPGSQYCFGDGVNTPCPCGNSNNGDVGGCDWGNPTFPEGGVLEGTGSSSMAANDAYLVATGIEDNFGIFFGANNQVNGGNGNPLNDGLRCAGGGLVRLTPPTMASGNQATLPMPVQTLDSGATSGVTRRYQYWFRTPTGPCGQMANLTNGFEIIWGA